MNIGKIEGIDYQHNFDVIFKWLTNVFTGQTLEVLGISTGKITEIRGLEPVTFQVKEERIDLLLKDEEGRFYHLEEERSVKRQDLYRFAAQHYLIAEQIKSDRLTTVIVASGEGTPAIKIQTDCSSFEPLIVNLNDRNGEEKLEEIKQKGTLNAIELVFLPMYGVRRKSRNEFSKEVLLHTKHLYEQKKVPLEILGALVVICNKMIPPEVLEVIWKELSMLAPFKYAEEIGKEAKQREIAIEMLKDNMGVNQIIKFTKLPEAEVLKLKKQLEVKQ